MSFSFEKTEIDGVIIITPDVFSDERGLFLETYVKPVFECNGVDAGFVQDNHSFSKKGVLRGLHYQAPPKAQAKLVYVASGAILDVAVDIRRSSPTYKKWVSARLSDDNRQMLYIPEGFAHGFLCLSDTAHVMYKCSALYAPEHERGIRWDDPELSIPWPLKDPILSAKDAKNPYLRDAEPFE